MIINTIQAEQITRILESSEKYKHFASIINTVKYTDIDTEQVGIKLSDDVWLYSEKDEDNSQEPYRTEFMFWSDFNTKDAQTDAISGYYSSIEEVKKIYGDEWKQIVLECAFEQEL